MRSWPRSPGPRIWSRFWIVGAALLVAAGVFATVVAMPTRLAVASVLVGIAGGALAVPRSRPATVIMIGLLLVVAPNLGDWLAPGWPAGWWAPTVLTAMVIVGVYHLAGWAVDRHGAMRPRGSAR